MPRSSIPGSEPGRTPPRRIRRAFAGRGRTSALALVLLAPALPAVAEAWHRAYERAQHHLIEGRAAEAEAGFLAALAQRPKPGCRLRTYGVKVRDYTPWYYLGVALSDQGRSDEAVEAFNRSLAEDVIQDCPGTQLQALDLLDRRDRLEGGTAPAPSRAGSIGPLREAALAAGAERFAPDAVARARALDADCPACPEAAAAWSKALSRARVDGPILQLLEVSAREAVLEVEMALGRELDPSPEMRDVVARAGARLADATAPADWLAVEAAARAALARVERGPEPLPPSRDDGVERLRASLRAAIARAEAAAPAGPGPLAAESDLARAKSFLRLEDVEVLENALSLAESARAQFVLASRAPDVVRRPALLELSWSENSGVSRRALLPPEDEP